MSSESRNNEKYSFDIGPIRPPSEGGVSSLLIRPTRNCPWNKCAFCSLYKGEKFQIRKVEKIKGDIDAVKRIEELIKEGSDEVNKIPRRCLTMVFAWVRSGKRTVFLQDSNTPIMRTSQLVEVIEYLRETFPAIERVTSYARSKTIARKSLEDLSELKEAGLGRLHLGLESGDDNILKMVNKGVTAEEHIEAGQKALEAGFELSEYVMPDLGGRELFEEHALNTANVLNKINPDYIRMRPLSVRKGTKLYEKWKKKDFQLSSPHERLREIKIMIKNLEVSAKLCFDHRLNGWRDKSGNRLFNVDYEGYELPEEKDLLLSLVEEGLRVDESHHLDVRKLKTPSL